MVGWVRTPTPAERAFGLIATSSRPEDLPRRSLRERVIAAVRSGRSRHQVAENWIKCT